MEVRNVNWLSAAGKPECRVATGYSYSTRFAEHSRGHMWIRATLPIWNTYYVNSIAGAARHTHPTTGWTRGRIGTQEVKTGRASVWELMPLEDISHRTSQYENFFHTVFSLVNKAVNSPSWMSRKRSGLRPPSFGLDIPSLS